MMCSPAMRFIGMLAWLITALVSLNFGLYAMFGWDFFKTTFMTTMPGLMMPLYIIIGLAGLWSLMLMIMALMGKACPCCCKK